MLNNLILAVALTTSGQYCPKPNVFIPPNRPIRQYYVGPRYYHQPYYVPPPRYYHPQPYYVPAPRPRFHFFFGF